MFALFTEFNAVFVIVAQGELFDFLHVTNCTHPAAMSVAGHKIGEQTPKRTKSSAAAHTLIIYLF